LASPVPGDYGGDRRGANLFGNSVVAVEIETGKYRWHFQTIHHDLWDHDPPAPPGLFDVVRDGRTIPALALTTKSGYMFILNRETGQPIFGVNERPVEKSDVPGEAAFEPATKYIFVVSQDVGAIGWIEKAREGSRSGSPYDKSVPGGGRGTFDIRMTGSSWPCQKPPWGRLTAVDSSTGDFAWQAPL